MPILECLTAACIAKLVAALGAGAAGGAAAASAAKKDRGSSAGADSSDDWRPANDGVYPGGTYRPGPSSDHHR